MKNLFKWTTSIVILGLMSTGCSKDDEPCTDLSNPECPNYDPCWNVQEPNADFIMEESLLGDDGIEWAGDDSIFFSNIRFSALSIDPTVAHTWYLGAEIITEPVFTRSHSSVSVSERPTTITVSHVVEYPTDNPCYSNETGRDSTSREYYLIKYWNEFATLGRFRCAFENETDSFELKMGVWESDGTESNIGQTTGEVIGVNFHNLGDSAWLPLRSINSVLFFASDGSPLPRGSMRLTDKAGLYRLEYKLFLVDHVVFAQKIN